MTPASQTVLLEVYFEKRILLVRYFTRLTGDAAQAEDIAQDLYLKVAAMQTEVEIGDPVAFLFRMAHNVHLNQLRSLTNRRNRDTAWHVVSHEQVGGEPVDESPSPEDQADGLQKMGLLTRALEELPEKTQSIFRLHKFEGVNQTDVARQLGISLSSVEKHLSAALKHLVARLCRPPEGSP